MYLTCIAIAIVLFAFWLTLSGFFTPLLLTAGALSAIAVAFFCQRRLRIIDRDAQPLHLLLRAVTYWPWLVIEIVKSALQVSRRILAPRLSISPCFARVPLPQETEAGRVTYANSITLTPGTIAVQVDNDQLLVHALEADSIGDLAGGRMAARVIHFEQVAGRRT
ncbi:MAG: hypothetical protein RL756_2079 [Pseudomonadota bacterium]